MAETIFTASLFKDYILPFLLLFVIIFAVLEKTKLFGEGKKQLNAILSLVIALIFIGFVFPKEFTTKLVLFLSIAVVVILVFLILYGFVATKKEGFEAEKWMKIVFGVIIGIALILAILWAAGVGTTVSLDWVFNQSWSNTFWTNVVFVGIIAGVIAVVLSVKNK